MTATFRRLSAGIAVLAMLAACGPGDPTPRNIAIETAWNTDGVKIADSRGILTNNLGYEIELDTFEMTTFTFELVPCEPPKAEHRVPNVPARTSWSLIGAAWAGHVSEHPPTRTNVPRVEAPLRTQAAPFDHIAPPDVPYCSLHFLIARLPDYGIDEKDKNNIGVALRIHGRYRKDADRPWADLAIESSVAHGVLIDFHPGEPTKGIRLKEGDTFTVTRSLGTAFTDVDFATMEEPEMARQVLRELVASAKIAQHPAKAG